MFLHELSEPQKKMFMALAKRMVLADWRLEPHEVEAIDRVEGELGYSLDVDPKDLMSNDNLHILDTDVAKRIVIYELMVLAHADLRIDQCERHVFDDLAEEMGIDDPTMDKLEKLAQDGYSLITVGGNDDHHRETVRTVIDA